MVMFISIIIDLGEILLDTSLCNRGKYSVGFGFSVHVGKMLHTCIEDLRDPVAHVPFQWVEEVKFIKLSSVCTGLFWGSVGCWRLCTSTTSMNA
jgi:hypothetical protein